MALASMVKQEPFYWLTLLKADLSTQKPKTFKRIRGIYYVLIGQFPKCTACLTSITPKQ